MNIIKFKDIISENEIFDNIFRGKYCWAVRWVWAVPLSISEDIYTSLETGDTSIDTISDKIRISEWASYVDIPATMKANSSSKYQAANLNPITGDIPIDVLKVFRTKLAQYILDSHSTGSGYDFSCYTDDSQKMADMLGYYAGNMENCTTRSLRSFINTSVVTTISQNTGCGCNSLSDPSMVQQTANRAQPDVISSTQVLTGCGYNTPSNYVSTSTAVCEPLSIYRSAIYKYMVQVFSDIVFWTADDHDNICIWTKTMVDEIIRLNFPLSGYTVDRFADCTCKNPNSDEQSRMMDMLRALSTALGYIITGEISGNRNFISVSLSNWATYLYEKMYWM